MFPCHSPLVWQHREVIYRLRGEQGGGVKACLFTHVYTSTYHWKLAIEKNVPPTYMYINQSYHISYIYISHITHLTDTHLTSLTHQPLPLSCCYCAIVTWNNSTAKVGAGSQTNIPHFSVIIPSILPYRKGRGMHPHFTSIPSLHQQMHIRTVCTCTLHRTGPLTVSCSAWNGEQIAPNLCVDLRSISE